MGRVNGEIGRWYLVRDRGDLNVSSSGFVFFGGEQVEWLTVEEKAAVRNRRGVITRRRRGNTIVGDCR